MKLYKKIQKSFGGAALYLDKVILNHLGVLPGDEVIVELVDGKIIVQKSRLDIDRIQEILNKQSQK